MPRHLGARLAVPLTTTILLAALAIMVGDASAADECRPTPTGIECGYEGTSTSTSIAGGGTSLPPLRYLSTAGGICWYWSRYPPGLDSWEPANDHAIILTRHRLPQCQGRTDPTTLVTSSVRAWEVFRAFPLQAPGAALTPAVGITNLPTRLHLTQPRRFRHSEVLPDGRTLEVEAHVERVWISWGDGTPVQGAAAASAIGDPGAVAHTYALKTCPPDYRRHHLDGPKCHPALEAYPVTITFQWRGRYRDGGIWIEMGWIDRSSTVRYDVDEVLGILTGS